MPYIDLIETEIRLIRVYSLESFEEKWDMVTFMTRKMDLTD